MKKSHDVKVTSFNRPLTREQAEEIIKNHRHAVEPDKTPKKVNKDA